MRNRRQEQRIKKRWECVGEAEMEEVMNKLWRRLEAVVVVVATNTADGNGIDQLKFDSEKHLTPRLQHISSDAKTRPQVEH